MRLSSFKPVEEYQEKWSMQVNADAKGERLMVYGFPFDSGFGVHAHSWLRFHVNGAFNEVDTLYGTILVASRNKMQFLIHADFVEGDEVERYTVFDSGVMSAGGFPRRAAATITGAEYIVLEVRDGGDGIEGDMAAWLRPMLIR